MSTPDGDQKAVYGGGWGPWGEVLRCHHDGRVWVHGQLVLRDRWASLFMRCLPASVHVTFH